MQHQDTEISFLFTVEEMNLIREALGVMPHDEASPIIEKIYWTVYDHIFREEDSSDEPEQHESNLGEYPYGVGEILPELKDKV
jgi:hypothetical protein